MIYETRRFLVDYHKWNWIYKEVPIIRYYPCIKYQVQADPEIDGTDTFIIAESMKFNLKEIKLWNPYR